MKKYAIFSLSATLASAQYYKTETIPLPLGEVWAPLLSSLIKK